MDTANLRNAANFKFLTFLNYYTAATLNMSMDNVETTYNADLQCMSLGVTTRGAPCTATLPARAYLFQKV